MNGYHMIHSLLLIYVYSTLPNMLISVLSKLLQLLHCDVSIILPATVLNGEKHYDHTIASYVIVVLVLLFTSLFVHLLYTYP